MASFRRRYGERRLHRGGEAGGQRSPFLTSTLPCQLKRKLTGLVLTHNVHRLIALLLRTVEPIWMIKVKCGHECRSCYTPTYLIQHPPVMRATNTAGEQQEKKKKSSPLSSDVKFIPTHTCITQSLCKCLKVNGGLLIMLESNRLFSRWKLVAGLVLILWLA